MERKQHVVLIFGLATAALLGAAFSAAAVEPGIAAESETTSRVAAEPEAAAEQAHEPAADPAADRDDDVVAEDGVAAAEAGNTVEEVAATEEGAMDADAPEGDDTVENGPPAESAATGEPVVADEAVGAIETVTDVADPAVTQYQQKVDALELEGGAYNPDLSEALVGLGIAHMALGEMVEAEAAFRRALHISRVNDGLYNINQLPIVERLIEVNTATRDWEELQQNYHYLYWVSKRLYGENDPRLLPVIDRIGRWHMKSFTEGIGDERYAHLLAAKYLYEKAVRIIEAQTGANDPRLFEPLYGIAMANYQLAAFASRVQTSEDMPTMQRSAFDVRNRQFRERTEFREETMLRSYSDGKDAMERIVAIHAANPELPPESHALALVHLADWYLLFDKWNSSQEAYSKAYKLLTEKGLPKEEIDSFFARPRSLPAVRFAEHEMAELTQEEAETLAYVVVSFDVSKNGKARNIEVVESNPEDSISLRRRARENVATSKFRPRLENGEPVETTGLTMRMLFED